MSQKELLQELADLLEFIRANQDIYQNVLIATIGNQAFFITS